MSRRECPEVGSELLAAVSLSLSILKTHLTSADPKVALRAASELTKLLSVCARNGIKAEAVSEDFTPRPPLRPGERVFNGETLPVNPPLPSDADNLSGQPNAPTPLNTPSPFMERGPGGEVFPKHVPRPQSLPPTGRPQLTSFLGSSSAPRDPPPGTQPTRNPAELGLPLLDRSV